MTSGVWNCVNWYVRFVGRDSSVGIATRYALDVPGIESRWGEIFRIRPDWPWCPSSLLYNAYWVSFPWVKRSGRTEVKERVESCLCSPSELSWPVRGRTLLYVSFWWRLLLLSVELSCKSRLTFDIWSLPYFRIILFVSGSCLLLLFICVRN
jgi:hypothetical protein